MVKARQIFQSADDMPAALATAVLSWLLSVADTKHRMGLQFSHWVTGTPALEAAVGSAAITQDELGHARSLYSLLRNFPGAPESIGAENDLEARDIYYAPAALMPRWESWLQVVAINVVLDHALQISIAQMQDSTFQPLAGRIAKITQEEKFHRVFGHSWIERLVQRDDKIKDQLQQMIDWAWRITSEWIGPDDDPVTNQLVAAGVLGGNTAVIRQQWLAEIEPILVANGLTVPDVVPNWADWDPQFRHSNHA
jgi:phenylacetate-CoA oxygenase PaaI subunit